LSQTCRYLMPIPRQAFHAVLLALFWPLFSGAQTVWTVSNVEGSPGDFESVEAALADARVLDGDLLELVPGVASYGAVLLNRPVNLVGLPDPSGNGHEAKVESLTIQAGGDSEQEVTIERLRIRTAVIERDLTILASCRVEEIQATGFSGLTVRQSWLDLGPGLSLNLEAAGRCRFAGNFITVDESGTVLSAGPFSEVDFHHNTIVDIEGTSEWILYRGSFRNNIIDMPAGRLALFQVETKGNVSTTESFWNEENLERIPQSDLFQLTGGGVHAYFLAEDSPAIGAGFDGENAGFTGGYIPMVPENLPGTETAPAVPPSPALAPPFITPVTIQLDWSAAEPVDGFELQVRRVGEPYEVLQVRGPESNGLLWENLLEETDYQIRLRTLRGGLVSPWTVSSILRTTHYPPVPVLGVPAVGTDRISVTWTVEESVGGFDLQIREGTDPYGETQSLGGGSIEVEIGDLQEGTDYQFRIRSANVDASSDWTESEILTTLTTPPSPDIVPGEIGLDFLDMEWSLSEEVDSIELQIKQTHKRRGKFTLGGGGIGLLAGLLVGGPIGGLVAGATVGAVTGALKDYGIDDKFIREVSAGLTPGTSALFLMTTGGDEQKILSELRPHKATLIKTTPNWSGPSGPASRYPSHAPDTRLPRTMGHPALFLAINIPGSPKNSRIFRTGQRP